MFLFYPDRLRLLILSGNLVDYDWDRIENVRISFLEFLSQDGL